jgi:hypothetical protein
MILNRQYIQTFITNEAQYREGHGAGDGYMGWGLIYYALVYAMEARLCVCLGSGGGYVPRCMRQAQRDLHLKASQTILVDNLSGRWGQTAWNETGSFFQTMFRDIDIWTISTDDAHRQLKDFNGCVDYIHIDADHGPQAIDDFWNFAEVLAPRGVMTLHDTRTQCSVPELVKLIRSDKDWELVNFPDYGAGIAIVRRVFDA